MCSKCGSIISVLYNMTVNELMNYARYNRSSPAAANGRLNEAISVLNRNGGCNSCIREVDDLMRSIF